jgi:hypothetical protein
MYVWMLHKSLVLATSTKLINDRGIHLFISCHILCWVVGAFVLAFICIVMLFSLVQHTIPGLTIQVIFSIAASSKLQFFSSSW